MSVDVVTRRGGALASMGEKDPMAATPPRGPVMVAGALLWLVRVGLGVVLLLSGADKIMRPYDFLDAVYGYGLMGPLVGMTVAVVLPWLEVLLGACLVMGVGGGTAAGVSAGLFGLFAVLLAWRTLGGGAGGDCGCGGLLPGGDTVSWATTLRAALLAAVAAGVACFTRVVQGWNIRGVAAPIPAHRGASVPPTVVLLACCMALTGCGGGESGPDQAVLDAAYRYGDGGGYSGDGIGSPIDIVHAGQVVRDREPWGTNSLGFTFAVMWEVAQQRGLLEELYLEDVEAFRREWFRSVPETQLRGLVGAMESIGIGREVALGDALPGDFVLLGHSENRGPSAIFLGWVFPRRQADRDAVSDLQQRVERHR